MKLEQMNLEKPRMESNNRQDVKRSKKNNNSNWRKENQNSGFVAQVHRGKMTESDSLSDSGPKSRNHRIGFPGVDAEVVDGFGYDTGLDFAFLLQFVQGG